MIHRVVRGRHGPYGCSACVYNINNIVHRRYRVVGFPPPGRGPAAKTNSRRALKRAERTSKTTAARSGQVVRIFSSRRVCVSLALEWNATTVDDRAVSTQQYPSNIRRIISYYIAYKLYYIIVHTPTADPTHVARKIVARVFPDRPTDRPHKSVFSAGEVPISDIEIEHHPHASWPWAWSRLNLGGAERTDSVDRLNFTRKPIGI